MPVHIDPLGGAPLPIIDVGHRPRRVILHLHELRVVRQEEAKAAVLLRRRHRATPPRGPEPRRVVETLGSGIEDSGSLDEGSPVAAVGRTGCRYGGLLLQRTSDGAGAWRPLQGSRRSRRVFHVGGAAGTGSTGLSRRRPHSAPLRLVRRRRRAPRSRHRRRARNRLPYHGRRPAGTRSGGTQPVLRDARLRQHRRPYVRDGFAGNSGRSGRDGSTDREVARSSSKHGDGLTTR